MLQKRALDSHLRSLPRKGTIICSCYGRRMHVLDSYTLNQAEAEKRDTFPGSYVRVTPCEKARWRHSYIWDLKQCFSEVAAQLELF